MTNVIIKGIFYYVGGQITLFLQRDSLMLTKHLQSIAFPSFALLCLGLERGLATLGALGYIIIMGVCIVPRKQTFIRNLINLLFFQIAMIWVAFLKDKSDRRMFSLREQLKAQYRATQKGENFARLNLR